MGALNKIFSFISLLSKVLTVACFLFLLGYSNLAFASNTTNSPSKVSYIFNSYTNYVMKVISLPGVYLYDLFSNAGPASVGDLNNNLNNKILGLKTNTNTKLKKSVVSNVIIPKDQTSTLSKVTEHTIEKPTTTLIYRTDPSLLDRLKGLELVISNNITHNLLQTYRTYESVGKNITNTSNSITNDGNFTNPTFTGVTTMHGATTLDNSFSQTGANTFSTGTGVISLNGDTTISGQSIFTHIPTLAHIFSPSWPLGTSNISNSSLYINPLSSVTDGNLIGAAVNGIAKFLVDAEGDIYANNLILNGSTTSASNTIGTLNVTDHTTLGDADTDTTTINGNTINLAGSNPVIDSTNATGALSFNTITNRPVTFGTGVVTASSINSTNLTVDTNTFFVDSVNHRVGVGTVSPSQLLSVGSSNQLTVSSTGALVAQSARIGQSTIVSINVTCPSCTSAYGNPAGTYVYAGQNNGKNYYQSGNWYLYWASPYWKFGIGFGSMYWYTTSSADTPPFISTWNNWTGSSGTLTTSAASASLVIMDTAGNLTIGGALSVTGTGNNYILSNIGIGTTSPNELLSIGTAGTTAGVLSLSGATSGKAIIQVGAVAGTPTLTLPTTTGTLALTSDITAQSYPASGIAVSTGSAWTTSITDNSANWNTAYGWGNHASVGYLTSLSGALLATGATTGATSQAQAFTNGIISPTILGGTSTTQDLSFQTTSGVGTTGANMYFKTGNNGGTSAMTILNSGNVGIGTTAPTSILALGGTVARTIQMERNTTAATAGQGLTISSGGAIAGTADLAGGDLSLKSGISTGTGSSAIRFFTATPQGATNTTDNIPTEKMTILGNGNVGIGTTSPGVALDITTLADTGLRVNSGDTSPGQVVAQFSSSNYSIMKVIANGTLQVGRGDNTTVLGNTVIRGPSNGGANANITPANFYFEASNGTGTGGSGSFIWKTAPPIASGYGVSPLVERMRIDPNGNVGIGTTNPFSALHIKNTANIPQLFISGHEFSTADIFGIKIYDTTVTFGSATTEDGSGFPYKTMLTFDTVSGETRFGNAVAVNTGQKFLFSANYTWAKSLDEWNMQLYGYSSSQLSSRLSTLKVSDTKLSFTNATDGGGAEYFTILQSNGNVGIGTTAPTFALDLGNGNLAGSYGIRIKNLSTSSSGYPDAVIQLENSSAGSMGQLFKAGTNYTTVGNISANDLGFYNTGGGNISILNNVASGNISFATGGLVGAQMILLSSGNVGIGTTSPNQQLEITKNFRLPSTTYNGGNPYGIIYKDGNRFMHNFNYGDNGTVTTTGNNLFIGVNAGNFTMGSTATSAGQASNNVGIGWNTLDAITTGQQNTGIGSGIFQSLTTGSYNTAIGYLALSSSNGSENAAFGRMTLQNASGSYNSALGNTALGDITSGQYNVGIGKDAGRFLTNGSTYNTTGSYGTFIGSNTKALADNDQNEIVIGYNAVGNGSNTSTIGTGNVLYVGGVSITGKVARFTNSTGYCDIDPTTTSLTCSSDINLKKNITTLENIEFILRTIPDITNESTLGKLLYLTPVTYNWNTESNTNSKHIGFIAQEMEQIFPDLVATDAKTGLKSISYANINPYLVSAIQEMNLRLENIDDMNTDNKIRGTITSWFSKASNMIGDFYANRVRTKEICVSDDAGETCLTRAQIDAMMANLANITISTSVTSTSGSSNDSSSSVSENEVVETTESSESCIGSTPCVDDRVDPVNEETQISQNEETVVEEITPDISLEQDSNSDTVLDSTSNIPTPSPAIPTQSSEEPVI